MTASKDKKGNLKAEISLPAGTSSVFIWQGKEWSQQRRVEKKNLAPYMFG